MLVCVHAIYIKWCCHAVSMCPFTAIVVIILHYSLAVSATLGTGRIGAPIMKLNRICVALGRVDVGNTRPCSNNPIDDNLILIYMYSSIALKQSKKVKSKKIYTKKTFVNGGKT